MSVLQQQYWINMNRYNQIIKFLLRLSNCINTIWQFTYIKYLSQRIFSWEIPTVINYWCNSPQKQKIKSEENYQTIFHSETPRWYDLLIGTALYCGPHVCADCNRCSVVTVVILIPTEQHTAIMSTSSNSPCRVTTRCDVIV